MMINFNAPISRLFAICVLLFTFNSCDSGGDDFNHNFNQFNFPPFYVSNDRKSAVLDGVIDGNSFSQFNQMLSEHPEIDVILFDQAPGSVNDDVNFQIGRRIRDLNLDTHILDGGIIAAGAVDVFLAGRNRTRGFNTSIGVKAWVDSAGNEATDFPVESSVHNFYINYYLDIGLGSQVSNDFYFFSINAANSNSIYFLTENDIQIFQIFTE